MFKLHLDKLSAVGRASSQLERNLKRKHEDGPQCQENTHCMTESQVRLL